ncbi:MAG: type VI secretion system baseplate subunit TssG [Gemmatimonadota bacterium]|nr:type VI secretion system baseplate subunit TssG [Gemmatimonadota bacterium]
MNEALLDSAAGEGAETERRVRSFTSARAMTPVEVMLLRDPHSFGFFQAVRILHQVRGERVAVGRFTDPAREVLRFSVPASIAFPPSELASLDVEEDGRARLSINFMGLIGPQGLLPHQYTLLVAERKRGKDHAPGDFLDLFHHRMLSLFYRAWEKHHFSVTYERGETDALTSHVADLVGVGLETDRETTPLPGDGLLFYAGLLGPQPRSALGLELLLSHYFGVAVEVEQFVGRWYPLSGLDQCELGDEDGLSNQLGLGAVAGDEVWDAQTCVRLRVGPLPRSRYDAFLPGGRDHDAIRALARFYSHDQFDFEIQLVLARVDVPGIVFGDDSSAALGWSTWIRTRESVRDADDTVLTF